MFKRLLRSNQVRHAGKDKPKVDGRGNVTF
jgi:hypothetical protein